MWVVNIGTWWEAALLGTAGSISTFSGGQCCKAPELASLKLSLHFLFSDHVPQGPAEPRQAGSGEPDLVPQYCVFASSQAALRAPAPSCSHPQPHLLLLRSLLGAPFSHAYGAAEDFPWVLLLALLLFSCVTLGKLLDVPEPQLSHL